MSEKQLESIYNMPRIQAMIDKDLKEYGYLRRTTLKCLGSLNIILDKNFKAKVAKQSLYMKGDKMSFKEVREKSGMNKTEFAKYFEIPYRTVQNWELETRKCPDYLLKLIKYKLEREHNDY